MNIFGNRDYDIDAYVFYCYQCSSDEESDDADYETDGEADGKTRTMRRLLVKSMEACDGMARKIFAVYMALGLK